MGCGGGPAFALRVLARNPERVPRFETQFRRPPGPKSCQVAIVAASAAALSSRACSRPHCCPHFRAWEGAREPRPSGEAEGKFRRTGEADTAGHLQFQSRITPAICAIFPLHRRRSVGSRSPDPDGGVRMTSPSSGPPSLCGRSPGEQRERGVRCRMIRRVWVLLQGWPPSAEDRATRTLTGHWVRLSRDTEASPVVQRSRAALICRSSSSAERFSAGFLPQRLYQ
jgi:hypothetical protein